MSDRLPWFRCFPSALLGAMAGLDADDSLIYVTLLLRIYENGGPVHETGRSLSRRTGLNERRASAALVRLIGLRKITDLGDSLMDSASTHDEIAWQGERRSEQSSAGKASAAKRQKIASSKKNDASGAADDAVGTEKTVVDQQDNGNARSTPAQRASNQLEGEGEKEAASAAARTSPETSLRTRIALAFQELAPNRLVPDTNRAAVWLAQGYEPDLVVSVIREGLGRKPDVGSLAYFDHRLAEAKRQAAPITAKPAAPKPPPSADRDRRHRLRLAMDHFLGEWRQGTSDEYRPGAPACTTDPSIIDEARQTVERQRAAELQAA